MQRSAHLSHLEVRSPEQVATDNGIDLGYELTEGFAAGLIRRKARQIARKAGFSQSDVEDLQQQFFERVVANFDAFDHAQGHFNVFVKTVVERYAANILRDARAEKRDRRTTRSLSMTVDDRESGPVKLGDTIGQSGLDARLGRETRLPHEVADLAMDIAAVMAVLPAELRDLCERLKCCTVSEISREIGLPRTTAYDRIRRLRKHFADAGARDLLPSSRPQTV